MLTKTKPGEHRVLFGAAFLAVAREHGRIWWDDARQRGVAAIRDPEIRAALLRERAWLFDYLRLEYARDQLARELADLRAAASREPAPAHQMTRPPRRSRTQHADDRQLDLFTTTTTRTEEKR